MAISSDLEWISYYGCRLAVYLENHRRSTFHSRVRRLLKSWYCKGSVRFRTQFGVTSSICSAGSAILREPSRLTRAPQHDQLDWLKGCHSYKAGRHATNTKTTCQFYTFRRLIKQSDCLQWPKLSLELSPLSRFAWDLALLGLDSRRQSQFAGHHNAWWS